MRPKWEVGDWCFWEFQLAQIMRMDDPEKHLGMEISTGFVRCSTAGHFPIQPLTLRNVRISSEWTHWKNRLHKEGSQDLNFPDISKHLVATWVEACELKDSGPNKEDPKLRAAYDDLRSFCEAILNKSAKRKEETIQGIRLYR